MEAPEEVAMGSKDHSNIVKGKRTKRLRPQSPIPFAITSNNSIYNGNGGEFEGIPSVENKNYTTQYLSPSSSSSSEYQDRTEEEEDMANCLILLAQGQSRESAKLQADDHHHDTGIYNKFTSRRFMEAASNGTGKAGYYVYECKTCNRTFPSFQALGGHRASHKKPKAASAAAMVDEKIRQFTAAASDEEEGQFIKTNNLSSLSLQLSNNNNNNNTRGLYSNNNKAKVHECSICGAEFTSGQALGGHMRRHRGPIGSNTASTALSLTVPMAMESKEPKKPRNVLSLDLDLNLPAPEDDHHRESKFPFASKQQQQQQQQQSPLVFSAPTLVDCHY